MNRHDDNTYYQILDLRQMATIYQSLFAYEKTLELCDEAELLQQRIRYHDPLLHTNRALSLISMGQADQGLKLLRETATHDYQNPATSQQVQLAMITGLSMIGDYEQCLWRASALAQESRSHNVILYGRARLWQGIAENAMGHHSEAMSTLKEALKHELTYAGRLAWLAYYALGTASKGPKVSRHWYDQAVHTLLALASSLHTRPYLQESLLNNDLVRWLIDLSQASDALPRRPSQTA
jgi:tetratricopeptide (TPR) repeat protein